MELGMRAGERGGRLGFEGTELPGGRASVLGVPWDQRECVRHAGEDDICASGGTSRRRPARRRDAYPLDRDR